MAAVAKAAGVEQEQVAVGKVSYQVFISYQFSSAVTEDQATSAIATAAGVEKSKVTVSMSSTRRLSFGRQLLSTVEATIASESADGLGAIATKAQDTDALTRAMADAGVALDNIKASTPKQKVQVVTKITSRTSEAVEAPESSTLSTSVSSELGASATATVENVKKEPIIAADNGEADTSTKSQETWVLLAGVLGGTGAAILCSCLLMPSVVRRCKRYRSRKMESGCEEGKIVDPESPFAREAQLPSWRRNAASVDSPAKVLGMPAAGSTDVTLLPEGPAAGTRCDLQPPLPVQPEVPSDVLPELDGWISPLPQENCPLEAGNNCAPCGGSAGWSLRSCSSGRACGASVPEESMEQAPAARYSTAGTGSEVNNCI